MKKSLYVSIVVVALVIGMLLAFQFRTNRYIEQGVPADRAQELVVELRQLLNDINKLQAEASDLEAKLEQADKGQSQAIKAINDELAKSRLAAGFVAVNGPGVEIVLDNPPQGKEQSSLFLIRDEDLLRLINELRAAGAEVMSINGQRIITTTEIRMAGAFISEKSFINVNLTRVVPPYRVLAVGNPGKLRSALEISGGLAEYLRGLGIRVKIQDHEQLTVPGYTGGLYKKYAKIP